MFLKNVRRLMLLWCSAAAGLFALISFSAGAIPQTSEWQFNLVAEHEGFFLHGLAADMAGFVKEADGGLDLYTITIDGGRTRVTRNRKGPTSGTIRIIDLIAGEVISTAASDRRVFQAQFIPGIPEVLFYQSPNTYRLSKWGYLDGQPEDCVQVGPGVSGLVVDSENALVFDRGERPIGLLNLETCTLSWGVPIVQEGQLLQRDGRPMNILDSWLLLPDRASFAYIDRTPKIPRKVVIRSVDNMDREVARIEAGTREQIAEEIFVAANHLGVEVSHRGRFIPGMTKRELRLYQLPNLELSRSLNIGAWERSYNDRIVGHLGTAVAGHPTLDLVAVATTADEKTGRISLYDLSDGKKLTTLRFPRFTPPEEFPRNVDVTFLQFSADGRYLVAGTAEPRIRVWEMSRPKLAW